MKRERKSGPVSYVVLCVCACVHACSFMISPNCDLGQSVYPTWSTTLNAIIDGSKGITTLLCGVVDHD